MFDFVRSIFVCWVLCVCRTFMFFGCTFCAMLWIRCHGKSKQQKLVKYCNWYYILFLRTHIPSVVAAFLLVLFQKFLYCLFRRPSCASMSISIYCIYHLPPPPFPCSLSRFLCLTLLQHGYYVKQFHSLFSFYDADFFLLFLIILLNASYILCRL